MKYSTLMTIYKEKPKWVSERFIQASILDAVYRKDITQDLRLLVPNLCTEGYCDGWISNVLPENFMDFFLINKFPNWHILTIDEKCLTMLQYVDDPGITLYWRARSIKDLPLDCPLKVEYHPHLRTIVRMPEGYKPSEVHELLLECNNENEVLVLNQIRIGSDLKPFEGTPPEPGTVITAEEALSCGFDYALPYIEEAVKIN